MSLLRIFQSCPPIEIGGGVTSIAPVKQLLCLVSLLYTKGDDRSILRLTYEVAVIDITHSGGSLH